MRLWVSGGSKSSGELAALMTALLESISYSLRAYTIHILGKVNLQCLLGLWRVVEV